MLSSNAAPPAIYHCCCETSGNTALDPTHFVLLKYILLFCVPFSFVVLKQLKKLALQIKQGCMRNSI
jgi:hypothetical protein